MADLGEQTWRRVRAAIEGYAGEMLHFIAKCYGVDAIQQGWFEFTMGKSEEFVQGEPNTELFFSWLFTRLVAAEAQRLLKQPEVALAALNNTTPLEAVRKADGREMVEALIAQFERDSSRMPVPPAPAVFAKLRHRLGLQGG